MDVATTHSPLNGSKKKMGVEEFIIRAIERLRKAPGKPVKVKGGAGLDKAFKQYFGEDIEPYLEVLVAEGRIKRTWGGNNLYTAADYELKKAQRGNDVLRKILED